MAVVLVPAHGAQFGEIYTSALFTMPTFDGDGVMIEDSQLVAGSEARVSVQSWGVSFTVATSGLTPGDVVTAWGIFFNEPSQCTGDCNSDDVTSNPAVNVSLVNVGGRIVGASGEATFFNSFDLADSARTYSGPGLVNAEEAEIHVVLVTHGPVQPENLEAQLTTPNGGCRPESADNPCSNVQYAIFKQVEDYVQVMHTFPVLDENGVVIEESEVVVGGISTLVVDRSGATMEIMARDLPVGHAVTSWWVIFNNPENCSGGVCNGDDVLPMPGNTAAGVTVLYGDGDVVGVDGSAHFVSNLAEGDISGAVFGPGLINRRGAEIHYVLRDHGMARAEVLTEQLTTLNGGCDEANPCVDLQFAVFIQD